MPNLNNIYNFFTQKCSSFSGSFQSSGASRNAQRGSAGTQLLGASVALIQPAALIPAQFSQFLIAAYTAVRKETSLPEKALHALLASLSVSRLCLASTLFFMEEDCSLQELDLCKAALLLELLYSGVLATGWVPSELSKKPYTPEENTHPEAPAPEVQEDLPPPELNV